MEYIRLLVVMFSKPSNEEFDAWDKVAELNGG